MRVFWLLVPILSSTVQAAPRLPVEDPPSAVIPLSAEQLAKVRLFASRDGSHYLAILDDARSLTLTRRYTFFGDGKNLYRQVVASAGRSPEYLQLSLRDPRHVGDGGGLVIRGRVAICSCGERSVTLQELPAAAARPIVAAAVFRDTYFRRRAHALARDTRGIYYYIDHLGEGPDQNGNQPPRGHRIFVGPRGRMKLVPMKNIASDPAGEVFVTAAGRLQLVLDRTPAAPRWRATWIKGGRRTSLTVVNIDNPETQMLIYNELGVYNAIKLQRPCDVF